MTRLSGRRLIMTLGLLASGVTAAVILVVARSPAGPIGGRRAPQKAAATNVLLISLDTTRADHLSCYGFAKETTPNIDALAAEGVRFRLAVSTSPSTLPAHASMLTGTTPPQHGARENGNHLAEGNLTLAEMLAAKGMSTGAVISAYVMKSQFGTSQGFGYFDEEFDGQTSWQFMGQRLGAEVTERGIAWLRANASRPFFLFLHYFDPHGDYLPPEPFASRFRANPYAGEIAYADHCVGAVIEEVKRLGLYDSTLIIVTADHGEGRDDHGEATHGFFIYQSTLHVPLVVKLPRAGTPRVVDAPVSLIDIVPTILGVLGLSLPGQVAGIDLASYWNVGKGEPALRDLYSELLGPVRFGAAPLFGLLRGRFKYIHTSRPELYDFGADPAEKRNLASEEEGRAASLRQRLQTTFLQAGSPRPDGGADSAFALRPEDVAMLRALGYATGRRSREGFAIDPKAVDPKDFYPHMREHAYLHGRAGYLERKANLDDRDREEIAKLRRRGELLTASQPSVADFRLTLGNLAALAGDYSAAAEQYARALELRPDDEQARDALASAYLEMKAPGKALAVYRGATAAAAGEAAAQRAKSKLVDLLIKLERIGEARAELAAVFELQPDAAKVKLQLAVELARARQFSRAEAEIEDVIRRDPANEKALGTMATTLALQEKWYQALARYRELLRLNPRSASSWMLAARILARQGDKGGALRYLRRARELDPENQEIARLIRQLAGQRPLPGQTDSSSAPR